MDRETVLQGVLEVFEDVMDVDPAGLTEASNGDSVEEWDSLSHVRLMVAVERKFGLRFSNGDIESITSLGGILDLVLRKAAA